MSFHYTHTHTHTHTNDNNTLKSPPPGNRIVEFLTKIGKRIYLKNN